MTNNKIGALAMITALLGGTAGALVTRTSTPITSTAIATKPVATVSEAAPQVALQPQPITENLQADLMASPDDKLYRDGFAEGFQAASEENLTQAVAPAVVSQRSYVSSSRPQVSRSTRTRYAENPQSYRSYRPAKRSFWAKHRDKLTVAAGAGGGAAIGGIIGGKKGAAIGALAGGGGSALYTYKLRKKGQKY